MLIARPRTGVSAVIAGALVAAAAAGCGSSAAAPLSYVKVEQGIASSILSEHGINTLVACPHHIPAKSGYTFNCTVELTAGRYTENVTESANSQVSWAGKAPFVVLNTKRVESAIVTQIKAQRKLKATASCPTAVLQQAGLTFTCKATTGKTVTPFKVTETDGNGHVTFVGT